MKGLPAKEGATEALLATCGLLLLLAIGKPAARALGVNEALFTVVAAYQLYVPLWLIQRRGELPEAYSIHVHGLLLGPLAAWRNVLVVRLRRTTRKPRRRRSALLRVLAHYGRSARLDARGLRRDVGMSLLAAFVTFPPFVIAHHAWQSWHGLSHGAFSLPPDLLSTLVKNVLLVALPEEMFYRGFVEGRLERLWPNQRQWIVPLGRTVVVTSGLFALGHFLGEWDPARLGPFFPAFVFSTLTRRNRSIAGAVLYHGMSNAFSAALAFGYH
jgi:membrane protease YdiL (CAAX protease family)